MRYIDVNWEHESEGDPFRLVSEIGEDDLETRKLEFFKNGNVGLASELSATDGTMLGEAQVPRLEEINAESEFSGKEITKQQFELLWREYATRSPEQEASTDTAKPHR